MNRDAVPEEVVDRVSALLEARIGLRTERTVRDRLRRGIRDEAADLRLGLDDYLRAVAVSGPVLQGLINRITVQETSFFRHPAHFEVLARDILPGLGRPVRIWSVGCANGQEAYSLAMVLEEQGVAGSVLATDLSTDALHRTAAACYTARETSGLSPVRLARHLHRAGGGWQVIEPLRARVTILPHNLLDALPDQARHCQVVFCRNVLIYLSQRHTRAFLDRVADTVAPVVLFLGSAETIWSVTDRFEAVRTGDTFVHRPRRPAVTVHTGPAVARPDRVRGLSRPRPAARAAPVPRVAPAAPPVPRDDSAAVARLAREGEQALAAGDSRSAVASFRKWTYLTPDDTLAHLHLGLALEAADDRPSAARAFAAARRAVLEADPAHAARAIEGYATVELLRLLDAKRQGSGP